MKAEGAKMASETKAAPEYTSILAIDVHLANGKVLRLTEVFSFEMSSGNRDFQSIRGAKHIKKLFPGTVVTNINANALNLRVYPEPKPARRRRK